MYSLLLLLLLLQVLQVLLVLLVVAACVGLFGCRVVLVEGVERWIAAAVAVGFAG